MSKQHNPILEKWESVLEHSNVPAINDPYRKVQVAQMLEAQANADEDDGARAGSNLISEDTTTGSVQNFDPVLISLVRRAMPNLLAFDLGGVQTMNQPTQLIFAMKSRHQTTKGDTTAGAEALFDAADPKYSGDGATGKGLTTAQIESMGGSASADEVFAEMGFTIDKVSVTAKARGLKADYTLELAQDLKKVHGLDAETELANILSTEVLAELNREYIATIRSKAVVGATNITGSVAGEYDLAVDADGRWAVEKFKSLHVQLEFEANAIAKATRRGKGNWILCSSNVATALSSAGILDYNPAMATQLNVDDTGNTFAGLINGRIKVFIDPYAATDFAVVGYRGTNPYDAGIFYAPYVPLTMVRATDQDTFQPKIGFKTRYGMVANPYALAYNNGVATSELGADASNPYFREISISNINIA